MTGLVLELGTEDVTGEVITVSPYQYQVSVQINGRFTITVFQPDKNPYTIAGDKKTKHNSRALLNQIEGVVFSHAPKNWYIREIINKYWPVDTEKSKRLRKYKNFMKGMQRLARNDTT